MPINPSICRERILSEDYYDIQLEYTSYITNIENTFPNVCIQKINEQFSVAYLEKQNVLSFDSMLYSYSSIPRLYGLMDSTALEAAGITKAAIQPVLNLKGQGVLIGFIDTGIDYTHPAFLDSFGKSRIEAIWDQTIQTGTPPEGFLYGTEYNRLELDEALLTNNPLSLVPSLDEDGHGTYLAGVAAGSEISEENFVGAAPESRIAMVKLKPAKQILKDYYLVNDSAAAYQENDILTGISYLLELQEKLDLPLVICLGLGTSLGGHSGCCILESYLNSIGNLYRTCVVAPTGNEGNRFHHYRGRLSAEGTFEDVEIFVNGEEKGFTLELWSDAPSLYTVGFISPTGEIIERTPIRQTQTLRFGFVLDETIVDLNYRFISYSGGSQLIQMKFQNPSAGVWTIRVYNVQYPGGFYDLWLPIEPFLHNETIFLQPDTQITLTDPSTTETVITVGAYNHRSNSLYINSGRGYTRRGQIKPNLTAPGVQIQGPTSQGNTRFTTRSGTSCAAAITAGAAACLFTWGITRNNMPYMTGTAIQFYLVAAARQNSALIYPNEEWGYGTLDLYHVFEVLRMN